MEEQNEFQPVVPASDSSARTKEQWLREGRDLCGTTRYTEALTAFEEVIRLDPKNVEAYYTKSYILYSMYQDKDIPEEVFNASKEAINAAEQAILLNPNDDDAYCFKGFALSDLGRYEEAINAYDQAIRLNPNSAGANYLNKGNALRGLRRYEEAISAYEQSISAYEQALRLDPNNANAYRDIFYPLRAMGDSLKWLGRQAEAQEAYEKARQLLPKKLLITSPTSLNQG
jgi:tetratricopeptide (TPR) repeat protein